MKQKYYFDAEKLASLVRSKRGNRGLRETAKEIGDVSPSTISRVENGNTPDINTFIALCSQLCVPPAELIPKGHQIKNTENKKRLSGGKRSGFPTMFRSALSTPEAIAFSFTVG